MVNSTNKWVAMVAACMFLLMASACGETDSTCLNGKCDIPPADSGPTADTKPKADTTKKLPPWCDPSTPSITPPKCRDRPREDGGGPPPDQGLPPDSGGTTCKAGSVSCKGHSSCTMRADCYVQCSSSGFWCNPKATGGYSCNGDTFNCS